MVRVVVDSSILIDYFRTNAGVMVDLADAYEAEELVLLVPTIVVFELWKGKSMQSSRQRRKVAEFVRKLMLVPLTGAMARKAGRLERRDIAVGNDALVAATALVEKAQLATLNGKDFVEVRGLKLYKA